MAQAVLTEEETRFDATPMRAGTQHRRSEPEFGPPKQQAPAISQSEVNSMLRPVKSPESGYAGVSPKEEQSHMVATHQNMALKTSALAYLSSSVSQFPRIRKAVARKCQHGSKDVPV